MTRTLVAVTAMALYCFALLALVRWAVRHLARWLARRVHDGPYRYVDPLDAQGPVYEPYGGPHALCTSCWLSMPWDEHDGTVCLRCGAELVITKNVVHSEYMAEKYRQ